MSYVDSFDAEQQVNAEERIASLIFDRSMELGFGLVSEEDCADLGRDILRLILTEFRPDLIEHTV